MPAYYREPVHGRREIEFPQLEMVREHLEEVPGIDLPDGYFIRTFQEEDEDAWAEIMSEAFNPYWDLERFRNLVRPHFAFQPERLFFLCHDRAPVGSAMAFQWPGIPRRTGFIYMLAIKKAHCGKAMGRSLTLACLQRFREEGTFQDAMLHTESFRLPAIKHYLRLGFKPRLIVEGHREKWNTVLERLGMPELIEQFGIQDAPVLPAWRLGVRLARVASYSYWLSFRPMISL
jgi:mycothiol synthase